MVRGATPAAGCRVVAMAWQIDVPSRAIDADAVEQNADTVLQLRPDVARRHGSDGEAIEAPAFPQTQRQQTPQRIAGTGNRHRQPPVDGPSEIP